MSRPVNQDVASSSGGGNRAPPRAATETDSRRSSTATTADIPGSTGGISSVGGLSSRQSSITITKYANAVPGSSSATDRASAPGSLSDYVAVSSDESIGRPASLGSRSYVLKNELELYRLIINQYNNLFHYINTGRQALKEEIEAAERSYAVVERAVLHLPPSESQDAGNMLNHYREKIC